MDAESIKQVKPDALTPAEIEVKCEGVGIAKVGMGAAKTFVAAMLAGAFIAFGGMYFCVFLGDTTMPFGVQRVVGGLCFCLGLSLVVTCGCELFTGNSLMLAAKVSNRISWSGLARNWGLVWLGNLAGSLLAMFLIYMAQVYLMNGGAVGATMVSVAAGKVALPPLAMFFTGIMCNILVCLAVWISFGARTTTDKIIGILLPISAFVACGFEHSVANMFFLPTGLLLNTVAGVGTPGAVTLAGVATNLVIVSLANVVGGGLVALAYWFAYGPGKKSA